jgi:hypothetical protein
MSVRTTATVAVFDISTITYAVVAAVAAAFLWASSATFADLTAASAMMIVVNLHFVRATFIICGHWAPYLFHWWWAPFVKVFCVSIFFRLRLIKSIV